MALCACASVGSAATHISAANSCRKLLPLMKTLLLRYGFDWERKGGQAVRPANAWTLRNFECDELARVAGAADREDDVMLAVVEIRHRRAGLRRRHVDRAGIGAGRFVVG